MKKLISTAVFVVGFVTPAFAQDAATFSGARVEALVGYDKTDFNITGAKKPDGLLYGVAAGYDVAAGGAVIGIEGEASDFTAKASAAGARIAAGRDLYIGGRIGAPLGPNTLLYGKVGYTNARIKTSVGSANGDGIRAGAGVEVKLNGSAYVKAEYRYSNYEAGVSRNQVVGGVGIRF